MKNEEVRTEYTQQKLTEIAKNAAEIKIIARCQDRMNEMCNSPLHTYLRKIINEKKVSIKRLAKAAHVSRETLRLILQGERPYPKFETISRLCKALELSKEQSFELMRKASLASDDTNDGIPLSSFLDNLIQKSKLTYSELEESSHVSHGNISKIVNGKVSCPSLNTLLCLIIGLQLKPEQSYALLLKAHRSVDNDLVYRELIDNHYNEDIIRWNHYLHSVGKPLIGGGTNSDELLDWLTYIKKETDRLQSCSF